MKINDLIPAVDHTWPPTRSERVGAFVVKAADPGGNRVSAARLANPNDASVSPDDITRAETAMQAQGRAPLFMVTSTQTALNDALEARGYLARDHTNGMVIKAATLAAEAPPVTAFDIWPPLAIQSEIWATDGVDAARRAIMARAKGPKTSIFGRISDQPAGAAYVGICGANAMLHALVVTAPCRRQGLAAHMMRKAAFWAANHGAQWLSILVTQQNKGAQRLYTSLDMQPVGSYHYREKAETS